mmetsp:Transcript_44060/g.122080  ORF Transcript_44060/g.122080 Transcript_44060/m.122080 type:complete len:253 (-) Transcript_44060:349-1107(-)
MCSSRVSGSHESSGGTSSSSDQSPPRCSADLGTPPACGAFGLRLASVTMALRLTAPASPLPSLPAGPVSFPRVGGASCALGCGAALGCGLRERTIGWTLGQVRRRWPVVEERLAIDESASTSAGSTTWKTFFLAATRTYVGCTSTSSCAESRNLGSARSSVTASPSSSSEKGHLAVFIWLGVPSSRKSRRSRGCWSPNRSRDAPFLRVSSFSSSMSRSSRPSAIRVSGHHSSTVSSSSSPRAIAAFLAARRA